MNAIATVHRAAWLTDDALLFTCSAATRHARAKHTRLDGELFAVNGGSEWVCATRCSNSALEGQGNAVLAVGAVDRALQVRTGDLLGAITDLRTLLREQLALHDAGTRGELLGFLSALPLALGEAQALRPGLHAAREALRERAPLAAESELAIVALCRLDEHRLFVHGSLGAPDARLHALTPEGERVDLSERAMRFGARFACQFETRTEAARDGWVFAAQDGDGRCLEAPEVSAIEDAGAARRAILGMLEQESGYRDALLAAQLDPALCALQARLRARAGIGATDTFGPRVTGAAVSIVLSLDADGELLEHHLAQIADDPSLRECELICVLDGPRDIDRVRWRAGQLHELYGLPFSLVLLSERAGAALMRDAGASVASAPLLLFLEAGVLAASPGWLRVLERFRRATPDAAVVAAKLLRADGAIDHAGFEFRRGSGGGQWETVPRFSGLHASLAAADVTRPVPAVSGACMLIDAASYREAAVDGWRYIDGGNADLDLCLRLAQGGGDTWYVPRVALDRLGTDRAVTPERSLEDRYNGWLLHRLRGAAISR